MWKNAVERGRPHMTIRCTRIACWIPKATNTHLEYVIPIAYPLQQWLHASASILRCTYSYIACLVICLTLLSDWRVITSLNSSKWTVCLMQWKCHGRRYFSSVVWSRPAVPLHCSSSAIYLHTCQQTLWPFRLRIPDLNEYFHNRTYGQSDQPRGQVVRVSAY